MQALSNHIAKLHSDNSELRKAKKELRDCLHKMLFNIEHYGQLTQMSKSEIQTLLKKYPSE